MFFFTLAAAQVLVFDWIAGSSQVFMVIYYYWPSALNLFFLVIVPSIFDFTAVERDRPMA